MYRRGIYKDQLIQNVLDCCRLHGIKGVTKALLREKKADVLFSAWQALQNYHSRRLFFERLGTPDPEEEILSSQGTLFH
ncbi:hypothetical protein H6761_02340 [Candidatus Nomurabacteria bacterium]|nr:hypothetical protein [Candidatus Nomurabacteria bacterium]